MARRRLTDVAINKALLNKPFGDEPSPLRFRFQAADYCRLLPIPTAFVYKDTAMTTTLIQWNGKQGIAQTDSGGQYPVARHQLDYAPYAIGSRIRIDVANG